jgi:hypothetical protein
MLRFVARLRGGRTKGVTVGGGVFAAAATSLGLAGAAGLPVLLAVAGGAVVLGLVAAYVSGKSEIFPKNLIDEAGNDEAPYDCDFCTESTLEEGCEMTKPHYGNEYVTAQLAETWRQRNPKAFVHLLNKDGELSASFGVLGLEESFTEQFLKGRVTDLQLKGPDILDFDQTKRSSTLYISGVVVKDPESHLGKKRSAAMLWAMMHYLEVLYGKRKKRTLYAIAVTPASEKLLRKLGFKVGCDKKLRQDKSNLFCYELTAGSWKTLRANIRAFGGSSDICQCNF